MPGNLARSDGARDWHRLASHTVTLKAIVAKPTVAWLAIPADNGLARPPLSTESINEP